jgi:hypothetical protein
MAQNFCRWPYEMVFQARRTFSSASGTRRRTNLRAPRARSRTSGGVALEEVLDFVRHRFTPPKGSRLKLRPRVHHLTTDGVPAAFLPRTTAYSFKRVLGSAGRR